MRSADSPGPAGPAPDARGDGLPRELSERPVQLRGSALARAALRLMGWRLLFDGLPARQGVAVVYPHTSNWDFVFGILAKWAVGIPVTFWGKDSLFRVPLFGRWLRRMGGVPVLRHAPQGMVKAMVQRMREARERDEFCWLALAPEGTRRRVDGWRSGFYRVAVDAGVPLGLVVLDYGSRRVGLLGFIRLSGDAQADMAAVARGFEGCRGRREALAGPVKLL